MKLHTENFGGNLHQTATAINRLGLADYVLQMSYSGCGTVVVFRMPDDMVKKIRAERGHDNPSHDDPVERKR